MFGETIKKARKATSFTQREVAKKVGISFSYLSQIENGRDVNVSPENIYKISRVMHIPFPYLLYLSDLDLHYKPQYNEHISNILSKNENHSFKTFNDFQKELNKELSELPYEKQKEIFSFLEEVEIYRRKIIQGLYEQLGKNASFSNNSVDSNDFFKNIKKEADEIQKEDIEGFNELLKKMPFELTKTYIENDLGHEVSFQVPAYKKKQINGTQITSYIPPEEALESFFDIENLLNLNSELLNFKGNKLTQKQKEQIIQFVKDMLD